MTIADPRFAAQYHTPRGRVLFFDSVECASTWSRRPEGQGGKYYLHAFRDSSRWLDAEQAWIAEWEGIRSPMGKHWAAFGSRDEAEQWLEANGAEPEAYRLLRWHELGTEAP